MQYSFPPRRSSVLPPRGGAGPADTPAGRCGRAGRGRCARSAPAPATGAAPARRPARAPARARSCRFENGAEELAGALFLRRIEEIVGAALFADPTAVEETDAVGECLGEAHLVGEHQHGEVELGAKRADYGQPPAHQP